MNRTPASAFPRGCVGRWSRRTGFCAASLCVALLAGCVTTEGGGGYGPGTGGGPPPPPPPPGPESGRFPPSPHASALRAVPAGLSFGVVEAGRAVEQELTVANEGEGGADVLSVSVEGDDFRLTEDGCSERRVGPRRSCSVRVRFAPTSGGSAAGTLQIRYADPVRRGLAVALRGEGARRRFAEPDIEARPRGLDFGGQDVGTAGTRPLSISNRGDGDLRIAGVSLEGPDFELLGDGCSRSSLRPGRECELRVRFAPSRRGRISGSLRVRSDDPDEPVLSLPLEGEGRGRREPDISVREQRLDFGKVEAGSERVLEAEVSNAGQDDLRIREVSAEGRGFSVASDACSGRKIEPGRSCRVTVRFTPPAPGPAAGALVVASNDPDERAVSVALVGAGAQVEKPRCPVVRLAPLPEPGEGGDTRVVTGILPRGECVTYSLRVQRQGRLSACVPPGYALEAKGFVLVKDGECRFPNDPVTYRRYQRRDIDAGTDLRDLTLTRRDDAPKNFRLVLRFRERRDEEGEGGDD